MESLDPCRDSGPPLPRHRSEYHCSLELADLRAFVEYGPLVAPLFREVNPGLDHEVRWSLLKLADLAFRAIDEPVPKLTIHLPAQPTPVEPQPSKKLKLSLSLGGINSSKSPRRAHPVDCFLTTTLGAPSPRVGNEVASVHDVKPPESATLPSAKLILKPPKLPFVATPAPPPPKSKPVASWAKSGLSSQEKKMIEAILKRMIGHPSAVWFLHPVDPIRHGAPTYFDVVKHPMDLSTISSKLKSGQYASRNDFADDFKLMLSNAYLFNPVGTDPHNDALKLDDAFQKLWKQTDDVVEKDKAKVKPPPPPPVVMPTAPTPDVDVDDELMEAANVPPEQEGGDEDAPFDDDVDELLLGSTSQSAPPPQKIKIKPVRRPAPDLDDLDAELYDAADASGPSQTTKKEPFSR
ncbi:10711_t:CDS:2, partial [Acaulospora colombiana]